MPCIDRVRRPDQGLALVAGLVLLAVLLVLGLAAVRLGSMEERMAGYAYDRSLAFQAAEAALREAEGLVDQVRPRPAPPAQAASSPQPNPTPDSGCDDFEITQDDAIVTVRACPIPSPADTPRWTDPAFTRWANATPVGTGAARITPQYLAEYLGNGFPCGADPASIAHCRRYRLTARAGGSGRAAVVLQSIYTVD